MATINWDSDWQVITDSDVPVELHGKPTNHVEHYEKPLSKEELNKHIVRIESNRKKLFCIACNKVMESASKRKHRNMQIHIENSRKLQAK